MVKPQDRLRGCIGFQWDSGNATKNWDRHEVDCGECEQLFFNRPLIVRRAAEHAAAEPRCYALGVTDAGRLMFAAFTIRGDLIRVISARGMTPRERERYES